MDNADGKITCHNNRGTVADPDFVIITRDYAGVDLFNQGYGGRSNPDFADIDGDGDYDLFTGDQYGGFWFFRNWGDSTGIVNHNKNDPYSFTLHPNYPNPFNAQTVITFTLDRAGRVELTIFDITGRSVGIQNFEPLQKMYPAGTHEIVWNAEGLASGVYLVRMEMVPTAESQYHASVRRVVLVK